MVSVTASVATTFTATTAGATIANGMKFVAPNKTRESTTHQEETTMSAGEPFTDYSKAVGLCPASMRVDSEADFLSNGPFSKDGAIDKAILIWQSGKQKSVSLL